VPSAYLDASALGRLLLGEPDAPAILEALEDFDAYVASRLVAVELRRLAIRHDRRRQAERLLDAVSLVPITEGLLAAAETVAPTTVAALDAIHLATALELAAAGLLDAVISYDARLIVAAREHDLVVLSPS
jgi:predicted nucleic acid-binding protein